MRTLPLDTVSSKLSILLTGAGIMLSILDDADTDTANTAGTLYKDIYSENTARAMFTRN